VATKYRKISPVERSYLFHDRYNEQPLVLCAVAEGYGEFDLPQWKRAIKKAAAVHPGVRLIKKGRSGFSQWCVDDFEIPVTLIEDSLWDGKGPENADFLRGKLSPDTGKVFEVLLIKSDKLRVVFRLHHGVGDATSIRYIVRDIFIALKGGEPIGSNSTLCDVDFLDRVESPKIQPVSRDDDSPTGAAVGTSMRQQWCRRKIKASEFKLLPRVMLAIKQAADEMNGNEDESNEARIRLTVDLRRHLPLTTCTTANCSGAIDVNVSRQSSVLDVTRQIKASLKINKELARPSPLLVFLARWLPTKFHGMKDKAILQLHDEGKYMRLGTVSKVNRINLDDYSAAGFTAETLFGIPPASKLLPFFISLSPVADGVEMVVGMPELLANEGRLEKFTHKIAAIVEAC